jgi:uncharacterized membrane protein YkoI
MRRRTRSVLAAGTLGAVVIAGAGIAAANSEGAEDTNETEAPITGTDLGRASQVALDHVGGGRVTGTEVGDEESYYEVEVTRTDGTQVDVQLDEQFTVVASEGEAGGSETEN